jgi:hypothetical protein
LFRPAVGFSHLRLFAAGLSEVPPAAALAEQSSSGEHEHVL